VWNLRVFLQTKIILLHGAFLTPQTTLGFCLVYIVPLKNYTNLPFGTLSLLLVRILLVLGSCSSHCPFRGFINQLGLVDLGFVGNPFTWCNNRHGFDTIKERLDKDLAYLD
jgi:hypothetical protein